MRSRATHQEAVINQLGGSPRAEGNLLPVGVPFAATGGGDITAVDMKPDGASVVWICDCMDRSVVENQHLALANLTDRAFDKPL